MHVHVRDKWQKDYKITCERSMASAIYGLTPAVKGRSLAIVSHTRRTRQALQMMVYNKSDRTLQWERASDLSVARCVLGTFLGVFACFVVFSERGIARLLWDGWRLYDKRRRRKGGLARVDASSSHALSDEVCGALVGEGIP